MGKCLAFTSIMVIIFLVLLLVSNCRTLETNLFQCPECESRCTSEYAMWGFLIVSLPIVLFLQYMIDDNEKGRQPRVIYIGN